MRSGLLLLLAVFLGAAPAAAGLAPAPGQAARFVANVEEAKAHLLISRELYAAGQTAKAALHSSHPVQELGNLVIGPIRKVDPPRAEGVRALLKKPRAAIDAGVRPTAYAALVAEVSASLDEAVERTVPAELRSDRRFRARVIALLLRALVEEYDEAWKTGRIVQAVEYHDAWGFFQRAYALYREIAPGLPGSAGADFAALARGFPGVSPPPAPLPPDRVKELVARLTASLDRVSPG